MVQKTAGKKKSEAVKEFKRFVLKHAKLEEEVKSGAKTWQELFEEWYVFGSEDGYWDEYKTDEGEVEAEKTSAAASASTTEVLGQFLQLVKGVDLQSLQGHVENLSSVVTNVQALVRQFSGSSEEKESNEKADSLSSHRDMNKPPANPFYFNKD